jgi:hypothetical protein
MKTKSNRILISAVAITFLSLIFSGIQPISVFADGTEALGPPSITIGSGSGIVAAGTGLVGQPATIDINVPGTVVQVLLYWEGQMSTNVQGDDTILLDGNAISGTLIGGPTLFFSGAYSSAFRADITSLGLVSTGSNTLTVAGCEFNKVCNGAGLMVIYDDGSSTAEIELRDGIDLAFFNIPEPRKTTVPQTFSFAPSTIDRLAFLDMFFSSVSGSVSGGGEIRPSIIEITVGGITTSIVNALDSNDGEEWDTWSTDVTIPAGASTLTVEAISTNSFDPLGASFTWIAGALSIESPPGGEGCTPGYWKQGHHFDSWTYPYTPETLFSDVFEDAFPGKTLLEVLGQGGGHLIALGRHTVAALLNAASSGVSYDLTVNDVIKKFNDVYPGGEYEDLKDWFEDFNEQGCPLNGGREGKGKDDHGREGKGK